VPVGTSEFRGVARSVSKHPGRPLDPRVTQAILGAALRVLAERGFPRMTMEHVAEVAGVGKPAIYRRFPGKAQLVVEALAMQLPALEFPDVGDTEAEVRGIFERGLPSDGAGYVALIGGLIAEHEHHPELIQAFRERLLLPRRAIGTAVIERGQARGDIRADVGAEALLEMAVGPFLARVFAGLDVNPRWRRQAFAAWWELVRVAPPRG
jgi:AcrR family transcriptional regulator